jgi:hypothetical protein
MFMKHGGELGMAIVLPVQGFCNALIYSKRHQVLANLLCGCRNSSRSIGVDGRAHQYPALGGGDDAIPDEDGMNTSTSHRTTGVPGGGRGPSSTTTLSLAALDPVKGMSAILKSGASISETEQESGHDFAPPSSGVMSSHLPPSLS